MKKKFAYIIFCGLLILSGCMSSLRPLVSTVIPTTMVTNHTQQPVIHSTATNMPLLPSPTSVSGPVESACLSIQSDLPTNHSYEGNLLLLNPEYSSEAWFSLYKLQSKESVLLPLRYPSSPAVSPNRTQFAIENHQENQYLRQK